VEVTPFSRRSTEGGSGVDREVLGNAELGSTPDSSEGLVVTW